MIAYAFIDDQGRPTGGGMRSALPEGAVALTPPFTTLDLPRLQLVDGVWTLREIAPPGAEDLALQRADALQAAIRTAVVRVNQRAGAMRLRIYTDIPGQDALYLEKRAEAVAFVLATEQMGEPESLADFPLLAGEVGVTAPTAWQLAQIWLFRSDQFKALGAATERARMQALVALSTAPDFAAIEKIEAEFIATLGKLPV